MIFHQAKTHHWILFACHITLVTGLSADDGPEPSLRPRGGDGLIEVRSIGDRSDPLNRLELRDDSFTAPQTGPAPQSGSRSSRRVIANGTPANFIAVPSTIRASSQGDIDATYTASQATFQAHALQVLIRWEPHLR